MTREERIRLALDYHGWDITDLAKAVGVSQPAMSTVVNGVRPGRNLLPKIAAVMGVRVEWITTGAHPPEWAPGGVDYDGEPLFDDPPAWAVGLMEQIKILRAEISDLRKALNEKRQAEPPATEPARRPREKFVPSFPVSAGVPDQERQA